MKSEQLNLFCIGCILRECSEKSLHCKFRLYTRPNTRQKRQAAGKKRMAEKQAIETGRTRYWREYKQRAKYGGIVK